MEGNLPANASTRKPRKTVTKEVLNSIRRSLEKELSAKEIAADENLVLKTTYTLTNKIS